MNRARATGAEDSILDTLARYGMISDEPVVRQSARTPLYAEALALLAAHRATYSCNCTRRDLDAVPANSLGERVYPAHAATALAQRVIRRT